MDFLEAYAITLSNISVRISLTSSKCAAPVGENIKETSTGHPKRRDTLETFPLLEVPNENYDLKRVRWRIMTFQSMAI
jgi:hypothetical protein